MEMADTTSATLLNGRSAEASSSKTNLIGSGSPSAGNSSFTIAQDYIPFDFGDDDDEEEQDEEVNDVKEKTEDGNKKKKSKKEKKKSKSKYAHSNDRNDVKKNDEAPEHDKKRKRGSVQEAPKSSSQRKREKRQMVSGTPWSIDVDFDRCLNAAESLHNELIAFADWISPTEKEHETRQMVIKLIRRAIVREWPDARLEAFGSQNTQLYMPSGDIDLVVVSQSMETQRRENVLRKMAAVLRRHNLALDVQVIAKAKVPIVKFVCVHGKLKVDISINQTNGIDAANYVRDWLDKLPSIRPLIMAAKLLLVQRGLSEVFSGGLGSYSVICLVINHLQMHPKIQRGELDPALNLGILFLEFLELYGRNFGYDSVGISIRGRGKYFTKMSRGWRDDRRPYMLSIEDPLDPSNDISKGSYGIISVRSAFSGAYDILSAALSQRAHEIARRSDDDRRDESRGSDEEARAAILEGVRNPSSSSNKDPRSLLGSIIGIPHDMFKSRRDLEQLWQSGIMQNKLGRKPPAAGSPEPSDLSRRSTPGMVNNKVDRSGQGNNQPRESKLVADRKDKVTLKTSEGMKNNLLGTKSDPLIIEDNSNDPALRRPNGYGYESGSDDSVLIMDEEELAASQGVQFSSSTGQSSGEKLTSDLDESQEGNVGEAAEDDEARDSRYSEFDAQSNKRARMMKGNSRKEAKRADGILGRRSRLDMFAESAPRQFVDDEDEEGSSDGWDGDEAILHKGEGLNYAKNSKNNGTNVESNADRSRRKNDYWASKGNAVSSGHISNDGSVQEEDDDVLLNVYN